MMTNPELRQKVVQLYKTLLHLGRDYPQGSKYFKERCHKAFLKNRDVRDPEQIKKLVAHGEFVVKEIEALYYLKKYRTLKQRYYKEEEYDDAVKKFEAKIEKEPK